MYIVLVNNAGIAMIPKADDFSDMRSTFNEVFNANITSVSLMTAMFLPLLRESRTGGRVINISSARGSLGRSTVGKLPPTVAVAYSVSKTALNALTVEFQKTEDAKATAGAAKVSFYAASPGHCKTAFNGYRGTKDPLDGAKVVVELIEAKIGTYEGGTFWEYEKDGMAEVPW